MKKFRFITAIASIALLAASCDEFLDVMPDNRTELDNKKKIQALITSAYPETDYMLLAEYSSDNVDDYGSENPNTDRFVDQVFAWEDITESDNEGPENLWGNSYIAIAAANQVIEAIEKLGGAEAADMQAEMAEALLCRAYNHFILVNMFAHAYEEEYAAKDPGITYMLRPEQGLNPKYDRNSVADTYDLIEKDILAALPYVDESYYTVPKYHFNKKAAYAFAAKFFLYYNKWDESVTYADMCLGVQPSAQLRDWKAMAGMTQDREILTVHYIDAQLNSNLLLMTGYSKMGLTYGPYSKYSKYSHGAYIANNEDGIALATLLGTNNSGFYHQEMKIYAAANLDKVIFWRIPYLFEYTDPVAQIGYNRTVYPAFTTDMVLLERAEANILRREYDSAVSDINIWLNNISKKTWNLTPESITEMMNGVEYSQWDKSTVKKQLNPGFEIGDNGSIQESLLQFVLLLKRVESMGFGFRWFDVKRYEIEIQRRVMAETGLPDKAGDILVVRDPRRALQIPVKVTDAGYEPNRK